MTEKNINNEIQQTANGNYCMLTDFFNNKYTVQYLYYINRTRKYHYRKKEIPKKDGSFRTILVPDNNLKNIQHIILHNHLEKLPISSYATAYHKGSKLIYNAQPHLNKKIILKMDISNFFSSITEDCVYLTVFNSNYFPASVGKLLTSLCCYNGSIVQGTPTAPAIANIVMKRFDEKIGKWCSDREISYTRYCDDMTFSGSFNKQLLIKKVTSLLSNMNLYPNERKTIIVPRNKNQTVTGITVNEKLQVPAEYRREIRKIIYYCNKFGVESHLNHCGLSYKYSKDQYLNHLNGKINYVLMINPNDKEFIKYKELIKCL